MAHLNEVVEDTRLTPLGNGRRFALAGWPSRPSKGLVSDVGKSEARTRPVVEAVKNQRYELTFG